MLLDHLSVFQVDLKKRMRGEEETKGHHSHFGDDGDKNMQDQGDCVWMVSSAVVLLDNWPLSSFQ